MKNLKDITSLFKSTGIAGLWSLMKGYRLLYGAAVLALSLAALARTLIFLLIKMFFDRLSGGLGFLSLLPLFVLFFLGLSLIEGLFTYLQGRATARAAENTVRRLRNFLFDHIQRLPFSYHDQSLTGDLIERVTSDVESLQKFYSEQAVELGRIIALFVLHFILMVRLDLRLGFLSLVFLPFIVFSSVYFFKKIARSFSSYQEQEARLSSLLQENLSAIRVVKAFARQKFECQRFETENKEKLHRGKHLVLMHSMYWPVSDIFCVMQTLLIYGFGAYWAIQGSLTLGTYVAAASMIIWIVWPIRNLGQVIVHSSRALVSYKRIREIALVSREDLVSGRICKGHLIQGDVSFERVGFSYKGEQEKALKNISFRVSSGQTVALLGSTGSGKTTLVNLLPRFYPYTEGSLKIDGIELSSFPVMTLRRQIGIVEQEPFLFSRSIRENISYGVGRKISQEEIEQAARSAAIHDVILSFPEGYDTMVGEKGVTLSGGQKQRLSIARTLLKDPRILILDDATSSVDSENEAQIQGALEVLMKGRTSFIIAHRLQTIMHANVILVMEKGRIVQSGNHKELAGKKGLYRDIFDIQSGRLAEERDE